MRLQVFYNEENFGFYTVRAQSLKNKIFLSWWGLDENGG